MSKIYSNDVVLIKRKNKFLKVFVAVFLIILISNFVFWGGVGISHLLSKNGFTWFRNNKVKFDGLNYYAIVFGDYETESEALECSIWTSSSGGAAYVYYNNSFIVVGQIYESIDSANTVVENFSKDLTYSPSIKQYKSNRISFKVEDISPAHKKDVEDSLKLIRNSINNVLEISNKIDTNVLSSVSASSEINLIKSDIKIAKSSIEAVNSNYNNTCLKKIVEYLIKAEDCLDVCINKLLTSDNYTGVCKYCACELFFEFYDFAKNIVK